MNTPWFNICEPTTLSYLKVVSFKKPTRMLDCISSVHSKYSSDDLFIYTYKCKHQSRGRGDLQTESLLEKRSVH